MAAALFAGAASGGRGAGLIIYSTFLRWRLGLRSRAGGAAAAPAQLSSSDLYKAVSTCLLRVAKVAERCLGLSSVPVLCRADNLSLV